MDRPVVPSAPSRHVKFDSGRLRVHIPGHNPHRGVIVRPCDQQDGGME